MEPVTATIAAAIIGAVTAAASQTASSIQSEFASRPGRNLGVVLVNETALDLALHKNGRPIHGRWLNAPDKDCLPMPSPQEVFIEWKESGEAPASVDNINEVEELSATQQAMLVSWIKDSLVTSSSADFSLSTVGGGVKGVTVFADDDNDVAIVIYMSRVTEGPVIGCALQSLSSFEKEFKEDLKKQNSKLHDIQRKFVSGEWKSTLSKGGSSNKTYTAKIYNGDGKKVKYTLKLQYSAGETTQILISAEES